MVVLDPILVELINQQSKDIFSHQENDESEEELFSGSPQCFQDILKIWRMSEDGADMEGKVVRMHNHS